MIFSHRKTLITFTILLIFSHQVIIDDVYTLKRLLLFYIETRKKTTKRIYLYFL